MFEKVNPSHPDKVADRIAGALVDMAYRKAPNARIAVEVLIGHGACHIIAETSEALDQWAVKSAVERIAGDVFVDYQEYWQDPILADNQDRAVRCGDNGIFKGVPRTQEQAQLSFLAREVYGAYPYDGKYVLDMDGGEAVICQSNADEGALRKAYPDAKVNPLGRWTGGTDVDTGATNRKLGSDMGDAVTGGGLHGKDLTKADVSVNIVCHLMAQRLNEPVTALCAIGDESIRFRHGGAVEERAYPEVVEEARRYIEGRGGFEKFAEWGLV